MFGRKLLRDANPGWVQDYLLQTPAKGMNPYTAILLATLIFLGFVGVVIACFWVADKMRK